MAEGTDAVPAEQAWVTSASNTFPIPAIGADDSQVLAHAAAVVLAEGDTYTNVTKSKFNVGTPGAVTWISSDPIVVVDGTNVTVSEPTTIHVHLTAIGPDNANSDGFEGELVHWNLTLNVEEVPTGINDVSGKAIIDEAYYTVGGVKVSKPNAADGQIYIVVRLYDDGTMKAIKVRN